MTSMNGNLVKMTASAAAVATEPGEATAMATPRISTPSPNTERRPVGKFTVEQAYTRYVTRSATYLGAKDFQPLANDFNIELGYIYRSPAIVSEDEVDRGSEDPRESRGRPGSRAPHLWIQTGGRRLSTLDLFGRGFTLLAPPGGAAWTNAARAAAGDIPGLPLETYVVSGGGSSNAPGGVVSRGGSLDPPDAVHDPSGQFAAAYGLGDSGAALVRPDGFVAWRAAAMTSDPARTIAKVLETLLMR